MEFNIEDDLLPEWMHDRVKSIEVEARRFGKRNFTIEFFPPEADDAGDGD